MELSGLAVFLVLRDNCEQRGLVELTANPFASHKKKIHNQTKQTTEQTKHAITDQKRQPCGKTKNDNFISFVSFKRAIRKSMGCVFMGGGGTSGQTWEECAEAAASLPLVFVGSKKKKKKILPGP
jgi:hypothetical protein